MNLPLQMRAVSRSSFQKAQILNSAGRVLPSYEPLCTNAGEYVCSCTEGSICCPAAAGDPCSCNLGYPSCGRGGRTAGNKHDDAKIECHDKGATVNCHN